MRWSLRGYLCTGGETPTRPSDGCANLRGKKGHCIFGEQTYLWGENGSNALPIYVYMYIYQLRRSSLGNGRWSDESINRCILPFGGGGCVFLSQDFALESRRIGECRSPDPRLRPCYRPGSPEGSGRVSESGTSTPGAPSSARKFPVFEQSLRFKPRPQGTCTLLHTAPIPQTLSSPSLLPTGRDWGGAQAQRAPRILHPQQKVAYDVETALRLTHAPLSSYGLAQVPAVSSTAATSNVPEMDTQLHQASCFCGAVHVETTGQVSP